VSHILKEDEDRAIFCKAGISGRAFLRDGDVRDFWLHQCGLPLGPSGDLAELSQTIKNVGKQKSRGNAFHLGSDEPANTFAVRSPHVPWDGELRPPSVVERWTEEDLLSFIESRNILNDKNRATFQNAEISGSIFLERGNIEDFWFRRCGLPIGPSAELARFAQTIKTMGKQKSRGNVFHLSSDKPANTVTVQSPLVPSDGVLQPPSVVERWTEEELLSFIESRNILNDKNWATFQNAEISGRAFLRDGDVRDFWSQQCGLPIGLSGDLAELAQTVSNIGKAKSHGNAFHLGPTNRLTPSQFGHLLRDGPEYFIPHQWSNSR
jgi:uncharacterized protein (DUF3820 family)